MDTTIISILSLQGFQKIYKKEIKHNALKHKKKITFDETMPLAVKLMDLETVILSEISQTEKAKYPMASLKSEI